MSQIHATSLVENGAVIGKNVEIGPFCHVGANVSIGDGGILKSHVEYRRQRQMCIRDRGRREEEEKPILEITIC